MKRLANKLQTKRLLIVLIATATAAQASVFSGGVPVPPTNAPGSPELILTNAVVQGPVGMEVREAYDFFIEGTSYNTGTGLNENYTMNTVDWAVTESASPAEGLSIDSDGSFTATAYPSTSYPRTISIDGLTTEGAPLDRELRPIEFTDSQSVEITRESADLDFAEWIAAETSLTGDDALETANPDDDLGNNLLEFAMDSDPESTDSQSGFSHEYDADDDESTFTLTIPKDRDEVTYTVQTTTDLSEPITWTAQELSFTSDDGDTETWEIVLSGSDTLYGRLLIEMYTP